MSVFSCSNLCAKIPQNPLFLKLATSCYNGKVATHLSAHNPLYIGIPANVASSRQVIGIFVFHNLFISVSIFHIGQIVASMILSAALYYPHIGFISLVGYILYGGYVALANIGIVPDIYILAGGLPFSPDFLSGFCLSEVLHNEFASLT